MSLGVRARRLVALGQGACAATTLRAEWSSDDGTTERFFDYALKKTIKG